MRLEQAVDGVGSGAQGTQPTGVPRRHRRQEIRTPVATAGSAAEEGDRSDLPTRDLHRRPQHRRRHRPPRCRPGELEGHVAHPAQYVDSPRFGVGEPVRLLQLDLEMLEGRQRLAQEGVDVGELGANVREQPAPRLHVDRHHVEDGDAVGERLATKVLGCRQPRVRRRAEVRLERVLVPTLESSPW